MKILNICVNGAYTDGFSYHENLLPKYHRLLGNDVFILASEYEYNQDGKYKIAEKKNYIDDCGIRVIRLRISQGHNVTYKFKKYDRFYESIEEINPDIIFCHLFQFLDFYNVVKYIKVHPNVKLYVDSHADLGNSARTWLSKNILHKIVWKTLARKAIAVAEKFYGVTPARVEFLKKVYGLPAEKCGLLVMGADDELVRVTQRESVRKRIRDNLGFKENENMVLIGGKIDYNKPEIITFIRAFLNYNDGPSRLVVYGSVQDSYKKQFLELIDGEKVNYVGWLNHKSIYEYFSGADIVVFPGLHSVMWEEAVGCGKPCVFRKLEGFTHIDIGGNCVFFDNVTGEGMWGKVKEVLESDRATIMERYAREKGMKEFSYYEIARRSISQE